MSFKATYCPGSNQDTPSPRLRGDISSYIELTRQMAWRIAFCQQA
jgi:hypothetical protein